MKGTEQLEKAMVGGEQAAWNKERQKVFRRAETVWMKAQEIADNSDITGPLMKRAQAWQNEDVEGRAIAREITALMWDELEGLCLEMGAWLVHGTCGGIEHAWFTFEGDPALVHPGGDTLLAEQEPLSPEDMAKGNAFGTWRYIVDVLLLDALPKIVLFSPMSPFQNFYTEHERFQRHPDPPLRPAYLDTLSDARKALAEQLQELSEGWKK